MKKHHAFSKKWVGFRQCQASGHWVWGGSDGGVAFVPPKRPPLNAVQEAFFADMVKLQTVK